MKVGIRDGMLGLSLDQTFRKVSQIGFDGIEVCMGVNYQDHLIWQDGGADQLKALSEDTALKSHRYLLAGSRHLHFPIHRIQCGLKA